LKADGAVIGTRRGLVSVEIRGARISSFWWL
jgi:hypothetical protein